MCDAPMSHDFIKTFIYLFIYYECGTKVHMKRLTNKNTSYEPTTHTSNR